MRAFPLCLLALSLVPTPARADGPFYLQGGETVVFLGDSITQAGRYVVDVEAFLLTRFPDKPFTIINHGISSETVSGTSEPDHDPRRPDAHNRFARDVTAWKPDVLVACFGMNDGNYFPFDPERFAKYQAGVNRLLDRARDEAKAGRVTLLTPPPFDPYRRRASDAEATTYGYKFAALDYDQTLGRYGDWLMTLPKERPGLLVVDVHSALNAHLAGRRKEKVSYFLAGDAVHPNPTGHWLMAQSLLLAWNAPAVVAEATVDASSGKTLAGDVREVAAEGETGLAMTWRSPLPLPVDPACDPESLMMERVDDRLNRYRLTVKGLKEPKYVLMASQEEEPEVKVGELTRESLENGLDVASLARFPTVATARGVFERLLRRRQMTYDSWRKEVRARPGDDPSPTAPSEAEIAELAAIRKRCQTRDVRIRLVPLTVTVPAANASEAGKPTRVAP